MALSILPKSEIRKVTSISHGYGEIPIAEVDGKTGWALPGNIITFDFEEARKAAQKIDTTIRSCLQSAATAARFNRLCI